jgi:hypothetical protein
MPYPVKICSSLSYSVIISDKKTDLLGKKLGRVLKLDKMGKNTKN